MRSGCKQLSVTVLMLVVLFLPTKGAARFNSIDPLARNYPTVSPYVYVNNNPLTMVDPDGRGPVATALRAARKALAPKLLHAARQRAVRQAWAIERGFLRSGKETSMKLSTKECDELLKTGRVSGWEGHHINSASVDNLKLASDPSNIFFVKGRQAHLDLHGGNWKNETSGPLIDRLSKLGGPALLAFFLAYDSKLQELLAECKVCADDDAWYSLINPWNTMAENVALVYGFAAARQQADETMRSNSTIAPTPLNSQRFEDD